MQRRKSTPNDDALLQDDSADPVGRSSAMTHIGIDNLQHFEKTIAGLLNHPNFILRGEAIKVLLGKWEMPKYLNVAVRMLDSDPEWSARADAATAMSTFTIFTKQSRELVLGELIKCLMNDEHSSGQKSCYEEVLKILSPNQDWTSLPNRFDRERDVDWDLLKPYLNKSQIPHTQVLR